MLEMLSIVDLRFLLMVLLGSVAGLFVGAIPGLSVSMATALLVSITYTWDHSDALAMIMGVYVVGVFSGAVSAILINIPGAPSSVVTTLDGYPMSKKGQSYKALFTATIYSFVGSVFGFAEVLSVIYSLDQEQNVLAMEKTKVSLKEVLKHWKLSIYTSTIGMLVGALPGAGGPVASFIAYNEAKRIVKEPEVPFGEGAVEGIMASESSNNACIGGALIPMLTLAVPGDAVTAIILSVFYVHGLQPGPMFIRKNPEAFQAILIAGIIACFALLVLGLLVAPRISKVITIPKNVMIPVVTSLCVIGSFACNNRLFDVALMFLFGVIGFLMRRFDYPVAPLILAMVLGQMMDSNFRQAVSLASSADHPILFTFGHWQTVLLLLCIAWVLLGNIPWTKPYVEKVRGVFRRK